MIVFKLIEGRMAHSNVQLEVLMDDHVFPSYTSPRTKTKEAVFGDGQLIPFPQSNYFDSNPTNLLVGDAFVRELEMSKITLRLVEKTDTKGDEDGEHALSKLTGPTLPTLQQCLVRVHCHLTILGDLGYADL